MRSILERRQTVRVGRQRLILWGWIRFRLIVTQTPSRFWFSIYNSTDQFRRPFNLGRKWRRWSDQRDSDRLVMWADLFDYFNAGVTWLNYLDSWPRRLPRDLAFSFCAFFNCDRKQSPLSNRFQSGLSKFIAAHYQAIISRLANGGLPQGAL